MRETSSAVVIRAPRPEDGQVLRALTEGSGALDVNTEYAYVLLGAHFAQTCAIAEEDGMPVGFSSGYILPQRPDALFIWQIAVDETCRGQGLARAMIEDILRRAACRKVRTVLATIAPSNAASQGLFRALAREHGATVKQTSCFDAALFSGGHEAEDLFSVGPLNLNEEKG